MLIHGSAHHVTDEDERSSVAQAGVTPWVGGVRDLYMRIRPTHIGGRRITHPADRAACPALRLGGHRQQR